MKGVFFIFIFTKDTVKPLLNQVKKAKESLKKVKINKNIGSAVMCVTVAVIMAGMSIFDVFGAYVPQNPQMTVENAVVVIKKDVVASLTERFSPNALSDEDDYFNALTEGAEVFCDGESVGVVSLRGVERIKENFAEILAEFDGEDAEIFQKVTFESGLFNTNNLSSSSAVLDLINPDVVVTKREETSEEIPFDTVYKDSKSLAKGTTKVDTKGENGCVTVVEEVKIVNGEEISRKVVEEKVVEAVDEVILNGTKSVCELSKKQIEACGDIVFPLANASCYVSSDFGYRSFDNSFHDGIDYAANAGTPVYSAWEGVVVFAGWDNTGYGNYVIVEHSNGYRTGYAHLSEIVVSCGETVNAGQLLGAVGSTGYSTGNHLHFNIRINGEYTNPASFF